MTPQEYPRGRWLARGLLRRCPRCGGRGIFRGYFRIRDRCPVCGYELTAEEGFFLGTWVLNFAVIESLLFLTLFAYALSLGASGGSAPLAPVLAPGIGLALVAPIVTYPFAASTWAAIELIMDPSRATRGSGESRTR